MIDRGRLAPGIRLLPSAEKALLERGVVVVPDFLANFAANSWWWWTLFGDVGPDAGDALAKIDKIIPHTSAGAVRTPSGQAWRSTAVPSVLAGSRESRRHLMGPRYEASRTVPVCSGPSTGSQLSS
ncbi:hypothetical protein ACFS5L_28110 [Streptomyces phyllanthi]|uniref:Uncharacterized protein n=1 Tax=Streptomyces phyllanthi TaxID=1803180 RepID=A0A5N8VYD7_9ACTN|nr:hypothetical protein [Streptomyces phyllanthi]MPY39706.1 hypothetical protein [Streptomyces phyllanthi]